MRKAQLMGWLLLAACAVGLNAGAQTTEAPPEDVEIIEMLELLENMDLLKEDFDLINHVGFIGEENGG